MSNLKALRPNYLEPIGVDSEGRSVRFNDFTNKWLDDLAEQVDSNGTALDTIKDQDTWHEVGGSGEPAFGSGWANFGSGFRTLRFKKVGNRVHIEGLVKNTAAPPSDIFTLPSGYRPTQTLISMQNGSDAAARLHVVSSTGAVRFAVGSSSTLLTVNISFSVL